MPEQSFKQIVRILDSDIHGNKPIYQALTKIYGISFMYANAICNALNINKTQKIGELSQDEIKKIIDLIKDPTKNYLPSWILNRRKDMETGYDKHLVSSDLKLQKEFDIKNLKKIKCYRGMRHAYGLPVRGQRTRSNFRKGKTVGVRKKGLKMPRKEEKR